MKPEYGYPARQQEFWKQSFTDMSNKDQEDQIKESWENSEHLRLRINPRPSDAEYPVFSDLNDFIRANGSQEKITVLDYGAGSSPYKPYFPQADYRRADIMETPGLRYRIGSDSRIAERDEVFDMIVSTQVLEHVEDVNAYLAESFRLLKKGGRLLVTTHGIWEEHGVPHDYQRWTEEGIKRDLKAVGYSDITVYKLTCGLRGSLFLFIRGLFAAKTPASLFARLLFKSIRSTISRIYPLFYRLCDKYYPEDRIVKASPSTGNPTFYIIIAAVAKK